MLTMTTQVARFPQTPTTRKMLKVKYCFFVLQEIAESQIFYVHPENDESQIFFVNQENAEGQILLFVLQEYAEIQLLLASRKMLKVKYCLCLLEKC